MVRIQIYFIPPTHPPITPPDRPILLKLPTKPTKSKLRLRNPRTDLLQKSPNCGPYDLWYIQSQCLSILFNPNKMYEICCCDIFLANTVDASKKIWSHIKLNHILATEEMSSQVIEICWDKFWNVQFIWETFQRKCLDRLLVVIRDIGCTSLVHFRWQTDSSWILCLSQHWRANDGLWHAKHFL